MNMIFISVIICSVNDTSFAEISHQLRTLLRDMPFEIVRINDALSLAEGYNRGARASRGDWLVFCHDDIAIMTPDLVDRLYHHCATFDFFGLVGTTRLYSGSWFDAGRPYIHGACISPAVGGVELALFDEKFEAIRDAQAVDGIFIAVKRQSFDALQGFDENLCGGFDLYDIELSFRAHLAGLECGIAADILVYHDSLPITARSEERILQWRRAKAAFEERYRRYLPAFRPGDYAFSRIQASDMNEAATLYRKQQETLAR
jgi:GT2 family glycosyltransferase